MSLDKDLDNLAGGLKWGWSLGQKIVRGMRNRKERQRVQREIEHAKDTGLPPPDTALGRKAQEAAEAEAEKLRNPPPIHGTARWGIRQDAPNMIGTRPGRELFLGYLMENGQDTNVPLVARYPGHLLTVAGTGQGKSATQIVFNLLTYTGSVVVIDPKGELYDLTAERRRQFGKVFRLAPLARGGEPASDRYNPLEELGSPRELGQRARRLAEMLFVRSSAANAAFWENEAINLLTALIVAVVSTTEAKDLRSGRTLSNVRELLSLPILGSRNRVSDTWYLEDALLQFAAASQHPLVQQQCRQFAGKEEKLLSAFVSEINANLAFFDGHLGFRETTATSDFRFADLAREPTTVYLTIPLKDVSTSYRFLRMMVGQAFGALEEQRDAREASVLFILDEFPALRDMEFMRDAVAQMRSAGAWFWFFVQDVAQLEAVYGRWSEVFLSQTDYQVFFGAVNDGNTKRYVSTALGVQTFAYRDAALSWSHNVGVNANESGRIDGTSEGDGRNVGQSINVNAPVVLAPKPLLTPFEVGTFLSAQRPGETHASTAIVFSKQAGGYPLAARRYHWHAMLPPQPAAGTARSTGTVPVRR